VVQQKSSIQRLAEAIGYPDEVPGDVSSFDLQVDDGVMTVRAGSGRLVLERDLLSAPSVDALERFAGYAAGRLLREEATLAWDPVRETLVLWQSCPVSAEDDLLRHFFEAFATSCDWWLARAAEHGEAYESIPETMIRP